MIKRFLILLIILLLCSLTPAEAYILPGTQEYLTAPNSFPGFNTKTALGAIKIIPKIQDQMNKIANNKLQNSKNLRTNSYSSNIPDYIYDCSKKEETLNSSINRTVSHLNNAAYHNIVEWVSKNESELVEGDIVQIIDDSGYIRYLIYKNKVKNRTDRIYLNSTKFQYGLTDIQFSHVYQNRVIRFKNTTISPTTEQNIDEYLGLLTEIYAEQNKELNRALSKVDEDSDKNREHYALVIAEHKKIGWMILFVGGAIAAGSGKWIMDIYYRCCKSVTRRLEGYLYINDPPLPVDLSVNAPPAAARNVAVARAMPQGRFAALAYRCNLTPCGLLFTMTMISIAILLVIITAISEHIYYSKYVPTDQVLNDSKNKISNGQTDLNNFRKEEENKLWWVPDSNYCSK